MAILHSIIGFHEEKHEVQVAEKNKKVRNQAERGLCIWLSQLDLGILRPLSRSPLPSYPLNSVLLEQHLEEPRCW